MKKVICLLFVCVFCFTGCLDREESLNDNSFESVYIVKDLTCNQEISLYHTDSRGVNYYTMCLNEITLRYDDKEISLKDTLDLDIDILSEMLERLTQTAVLYDGGTSIYKDFGYSKVVFDDFGNTGFTVIKCNTLDGNNDYYFGDLSLEYIDDYCK